MTRFCTILLLITLLFPPFTAASISMACSMPDMDAMSMAHPMDHASEMPMDEGHACCTMPEPEAACEIEITDEAYTCCNEVRITRDQSQIRILPVPRYDASDMSQAAVAVVTDLTVNVMPVSRSVSAHTIFPPLLSPPLQSLLCTYII